MLPRRSTNARAIGALRNLTFLAGELAAARGHAEEALSRHEEPAEIMARVGDEGSRSRSCRPAANHNTVVFLPHGGCHSSQSPRGLNQMYVAISPTRRLRHPIQGLSNPHYSWRE